MKEKVFKLFFEGGKLLFVNPIACEKGTKINVSHIFYNTPVREKFLKKVTQEKIEIKKEIIKHILASKNVGFNYWVITSTSKTKVISIPKSYSLKEKIFALFNSNNLSKNLIFIQDSFNNFKVSGFISNQKIRSNNRKKQYLFIGGRCIENSSFLKAVKDVYNNILPTNTFPVCFIKVIVPSQEVDINIHPQKKEVKFQNNSDFYRVVFHTLKKNLFENIFENQTKEFTNSNVAFNQKIENIKYDFNEKDLNKFQYLSQEKPIKNISFEKNIFKEKSIEDKEKQKQKVFDIEANSFSNKNSSQDLTTSVNIDKHSQKYFNYVVLGQVSNCYILFSVENDLFIMDQHAAHERINFDNLMQQIKTKSYNKQTLLIPMIFEKDILEKEIILNHKNQLKELLIEVEDFGFNSIKIETLPNYIKENYAKDLLEKIFNFIIENKELNKEILLKDIIARTACRMSIMSGDPLSLSQMQDLLKTLYSKNYIYNCPHGRPFVKKISQKELENFFERSRHIFNI